MASMISVAVVRWPRSWAAGRRGWALAVAAWFGLSPLAFVALENLPGRFATQVPAG